MTTFRSKNYFFRIDNKEAYGVVAMSFFVVRIGRLSMEKWHTLGIDLRRWAHLISQWAAIFVGSLWNMQGLHTHKTRNEKGSGSLCGSQQTTSKSTLFSDAKPAEDFAQQVVGRKFASDLAQSPLGQAQFFGQQIEVFSPMAQPFSGMGQMAVHR